jgi:hypothetical protein
MNDIHWLKYLLLFLSLSLVEGHMRMSYPAPIRSPEEGVNVDFDQTSPLGQFPCKGFLSAPGHSSVATFAAGSSIAVK